MSTVSVVECCNRSGSYRDMGTTRIQALRKERGWNQEELGKRLHTTGVSAGRYEKEDDRLTLPLLKKIAKVFDTTVADIIGEDLSGGPHAVGQYYVPAFRQRAAGGAGSVAVEQTPEPEYFLSFREVPTYECDLRLFSAANR